MEARVRSRRSPLHLGRISSTSSLGLAGKGLVWPEQAIWMMQPPKHLLRWFICHSVFAVLALKDPPLSLPLPIFTSPSSHILQQ